MEIVGLIFSCISIIRGVIILVVTSILNQLLPKLGYVAYQNAAAGSYSAGNYVMDFMFANILAGLMIVVGIILVVYLYRKELK